MSICFLWESKKFPVYENLHPVRHVKFLTSANPRQSSSFRTQLRHPSHLNNFVFKRKTVENLTPFKGKWMRRSRVNSQIFSIFTYLMGPYNASPNFTPAPLTPALITPVSKIPLPPFRAGVKRAARYIYWNYLF